MESLAKGGDTESRLILDSVQPIPAAALYLWNDWVDMGLTVRTGGGMGPAPLTLHDVGAWERYNCRRLVDWERRAIFRLDAAWRRSLNAQDDEPERESHE